MSDLALAERVVELLGGHEPIAVGEPNATRWRSALAASGARVARDAEPVPSAMVCFLGEPGDTVRRVERLDGLRARLEPGGRLVVLDHNQPRRRPGRVGATLWLWRQGLGPARARYPTAREVAAHGFVVETLHLEAGERVQIVVARLR